jgi:hypothetical protein
MILRREEVPGRVSAALGRPARWATSEHLVGDYEGRERTLEVFLAEPHDQRGLVRSLRPLRPAIEAAAGGPVIVIFHTRAESERLYRDALPHFALKGVRVEARGGDQVVRADRLPLDATACVRFSHGTLALALPRGPP